MYQMLITKLGNRQTIWRRLGGILLLLSLGVGACSPVTRPEVIQQDPTVTPTPAESPTPIPDRPVYQPGELVEYTVQTGDTLTNLAVRFNTEIDQIRTENPVIPPDATTLPPGLPMQIPIYYESLWGTAFQMLPNSAFVNGPAQQGFDPADFVDDQVGWLASYSQYAAQQTRSGAEIVRYIASRYSISPRVLLALLEYQTGALSDPVPPGDLDAYPLGHRERGYHGLYIQLVWAANTLNQGYYGWQEGHLDTIELPDGTIEHPDPWQNAATVALQYYFSRELDPEAYRRAVSSDGFSQTYQSLFEDPWSYPPHLPGSLQQPDLSLPFESGKTWALTGGPHTGWGSGDPWAALDFAPPSVAGGCTPTSDWAVAVAPGLIVRSQEGLVELDLDGDGDPRTGWVIFYLHIGTQGRVKAGTRVKQGDPIGHPSCEGGESTGSHIHIARKYNGEWIPADGVIPFNLDGWIAQAGPEEYAGGLTRFTDSITASVDAEKKSLLPKTSQP